MLRYLRPLWESSYFTSKWNREWDSATEINGYNTVVGFTKIKPKPADCAFSASHVVSHHYRPDVKAADTL